MPDHFHLLSHLLDLLLSQSSPLMRIHYQPDFHPGLADHCAPPLHFRRQPPQLNYPSNTVLNPDNGSS